ncbi:MAG: PLDc_N domain-containing protein [Deltaproteobacteria bacterium]|nr:PLDc_N domain-containing protein [Deltaproteobacteria bacterium]
MIVGYGHGSYSKNIVACWGVYNRSFPTFKAKVIWFAVVTLLPPIGALVYIAVGRHRASEIAEDVEAQEVDAAVEQDETEG